MAERRTSRGHRAPGRGDPLSADNADPAAKQRRDAAQREYTVARTRLAELVRVADMLARPPTFGKPQAEPGSLPPLAFGDALDRARALVP